MNTHFFVGMIILGGLLGGFVSGFNFRKPLKGDSHREQKPIGKRMVAGMFIGAIVGGVIGFFVH